MPTKTRPKKSSPTSKHRDMRAFLSLSEQEQLDLVAITIDPTCLRVFKDGDVLPRGAECSTAEKENEIQAFRKRAAYNKAATILRVIGVLK